MRLILFVAVDCPITHVLVKLALGEHTAHEAPDAVGVSHAPMFWLNEEAPRIIQSISQTPAVSQLIDVLVEGEERYTILQYCDMPSIQSRRPQNKYVRHP